VQLESWHVLTCVLLSLRVASRRAAQMQVNLIIANEITPHLTAEEYMDKGEYENELKQVCTVPIPCVPTVHVQATIV
jgi:hypothetical protein